MNPQAVTGLPGGGGIGNGVVAQTIDETTNGSIDKWHYHHEDQLGTLSCMKAALPCRFVRFANGMTDADGAYSAPVEYAAEAQTLIATGT